MEAGWIGGKGVRLGRNVDRAGGTDRAEVRMAVSGRHRRTGERSRAVVTGSSER